MVYTSYTQNLIKSKRGILKLKQAIFAVAENLAFGLDLGLPWDSIPDDLPTFKKLTEGTDLVMGRTTYESLPFKPTANRQFIVVSSSLPQPDKANIIILRPENLNTFLKSTGRRVSLIGGMSLLTEENLKLMDKVYMTEVRGEFVADVFLPTSVYNYVKSKESVPVFSNEQAEMRLYA